MRCYKHLIWLCAILLIANTQICRGQSDIAGNTRFDALVGEQMSKFVERDFWQQPAVLLELMDIQPAETIVDLGCGTGYFALKLAERVGPDGKVIAMDTDATKLNQLRLLRRYAQLAQIEIVENEASDLKLRASGLDKIVILNTYHELADIEAILSQCKTALKPGGKIFIIDKVADKMDNDKANRKKLIKNHFIRRNIVETELASAGFNLIEGIDKYTENEKANPTRKTNWFVVVASKE